MSNPRGAGPTQKEIQERERQDANARNMNRMGYLAKGHLVNVTRDDLFGQYFPDYSLDELMGIACLILEEQKYSFSEEAESAFRDYLERRREQPRFANGRSVRNALERARLRQATRIVRENNHNLSRHDLMRIEAEDILASRVFDEDGEENGNGENGNGSRDKPDKKDVE